MQEEPGLSSLPSLPGRVTWVLGYLCVSGPGQGPGVLDPACLPAPWDVEQHRNSMEKSGNSSWHREGLQLWVFPTRLGTRCAHTHSCSGSLRECLRQDLGMQRFVGLLGIASLKLLSPAKPSAEVRNASGDACLWG